MNNNRGGSRRLKRMTSKKIDSLENRGQPAKKHQPLKGKAKAKATKTTPPRQSTANPVSHSTKDKPKRKQVAKDDSDYSSDDEQETSRSVEDLTTTPTSQATSVSGVDVESDDDDDIEDITATPIGKKDTTTPYNPFRKNEDQDTPPKKLEPQQTKQAYSPFTKNGQQEEKNELIFQVAGAINATTGIVLIVNAYTDGILHPDGVVLW